MATPEHQSETAPDILYVTRFVPAPPARVFDAWTTPADLQKWWGPKGVRCQSAEIDLRVGGQYKIANELPDGTIIWIAGAFEEIDRPHRLVYTWTVTPGPDAVERVIVRFDPQADGTNLRIEHERIPTRDLRERHRQGWLGCLEGLVGYVGAPAQIDPD